MNPPFLFILEIFAPIQSAPTAMRAKISDSLASVLTSTSKRSYYDDAYGAHLTGALDFTEKSKCSSTCVQSDHVFAFNAKLICKQENDSEIMKFHKFSVG